MLAEFMRACKGRSMLSTNDHPDIRRVFEGLPMRDLSIKYSTASAHGSLKTSQELVITNWDVGSAVGGLF
ncbi:MAG: adenine modification methytransferase [Burkholderia gladioli]